MDGLLVQTILDKALIGMSAIIEARYVLWYLRRTIPGSIGIDVEQNAHNCRAWEVRLTPPRGESLSLTYVIPPFRVVE